MHCLENVFNDRMWLWSPRLLDLNPCNLYLWDMLNDEVYSNNTCSEGDLERGIHSADPTISPAEPSLFFKNGKSLWSDQWYGPDKLRTLHILDPHPTGTGEFSKLKPNWEERNPGMTYLLCNTLSMTVSSSPKFVISKVSTSCKQQNRCE